MLSCWSQGIGTKASHSSFSWAAVCNQQKNFWGKGGGGSRPTLADYWLRHWTCHIMDNTILVLERPWRFTRAIRAPSGMHEGTGETTMTGIDDKQGSRSVLG
jgi:hypothetical protein